MNRAAKAPRLLRGQCALIELVAIEKAHDVRTLRVCHHCDEIGHAQSMIDRPQRRRRGFKSGSPARWFHGRCYAAAYGVEALVSLPAEQLNRLPIGDIGLRLMRLVCAKVLS